MSNYKKYLLRQLGIKESQFKPSIVERNAYPGIDPDELEQGEKDEEEEHHMSPDKAKTTALQHLKGKDQGHYYSGMEQAKDKGMLKDMVSPTARPTPIIGVSIRGSTTGGLPSGADQTGISPSTPTGRLGGYEPIPIAKDNSEVIDKTPKNSAICSSNPISEPTGNDGEKHAHQVQNSTGEAPQAVTGASDDSDDTLTLKSAVPKDIEVGGDEGDESNDMDGEEDEEGSDPESATELREGTGDCNCGSQDKAEHDPHEKWCNVYKKKVNEGKHKGGCTCGFCKNKGKFGKKKEGGPSAADNVKKSFKKKEVDDGGDKKENKFITLDGDAVPESEIGKQDKKKDIEETYKKHKKLMNEKLGLENGPEYSCGAGGVPTTTLLEVKQSLQEKAIAGTMNKKESETFRVIQEVLAKRKL